MTARLLYMEHVVATNTALEELRDALTKLQVRAGESLRHSDHSPAHAKALRDLEVGAQALRTTLYSDDIDAAVCALARQASVLL
jgi:hypothetical protein